MTTKIREITKLESVFIKTLVGCAGGHYASIPRTMIGDSELVKLSQVNAIVNNLKAIGIVETSSDLFDKTTIKLTFRGKHAYRKIIRNEIKNHLKLNAQ